MSPVGPSVDYEKSTLTQHVRDPNRRTTPTVRQRTKTRARRCGPETWRRIAPRLLAQRNTDYLLQWHGTIGSQNPPKRPTPDLQTMRTMNTRDVVLLIAKTEGHALKMIVHHVPDSQTDADIAATFQAVSPEGFRVILSPNVHA